MTRFWTACWWPALATCAVCMGCSKPQPAAGVAKVTTEAQAGSSGNEFPKQSGPLAKDSPRSESSEQATQSGAATVSPDEPGETKTAPAADTDQPSASAKGQLAGASAPGDAGSDGPQIIAPANSRPDESAQPASEQHATATVAAGAGPANANVKHTDPHPKLPIFRKWTDPKLALVLTGDQMGYIEPCGCAGLENQKGGLRRRHTMLKELAAKGWPVAALDVGGNIKRFDRQTEIKYSITVNALATMGYAAVALGKEELRLGAGSLLAVAQEEKNVGRVVSANVGLFELGGEFTEQYVVFEAGGFKIGVTSILANEFQAEINNADIQFCSAEKGIAAVLPKLEAEKCDYLVLLSHAKPATTEKLAKAFPQFDIVVTADGAAEPPLEMKTVNGSDRPLVEVGLKGMYAVVLGLGGKGQPIQYQSVPLDDRFPDSPEMQAMLVSYQDQLAQLGWDGLELRRQSHPRAGGGSDELAGQFVGSAKCGECHEEELKIWQGTPHSHATQSLVDLAPPRQHDPECISCHSTGWNPQEYYPYLSGFDNLEATPLLAGNGCENCHGPGGSHVTAEEGGTPDEQKELRERMRLLLEDADKTCVECHDDDNDPHFAESDFIKDYWEKIEH